MVYDFERFIFGKSLALSEDAAEVALAAELEHQVNVVLGEEAVVDADDEGARRRVHLVR